MEVEELVSRSDRQQILAQHGPICHLCGNQITGLRFDIDHVIPRSRGGADELSNLRPTHAVCNRSKSASDAPTWTREHAKTDARPGVQFYDAAIGIREYVTAVAAAAGNVFVPLSKTIDGGARLKRATPADAAELAKHGAYLTDGHGAILPDGSNARYVVWPHVAMRHPRYNGGLDSKLDRAAAESWGFVMRGKGTDASRRQMVANAAKAQLKRG